MKTKALAITLLLMASLPFGANRALALSTPSSLLVQVYGVWVSTDPLCTNPINLFNKDNPETTDFLQGPTVGGGDIPDGTYPCVIIKMSDVISFGVTSTTGSCAAGTTYNIDLCRSGSYSQYPSANGVGGGIGCLGTSQTGAGVQANIVYLYLSTSSTCAGSSGTCNNTTGTISGSFTSPLGNAGNGITLSSPLVIAGAGRAKFTVNATGTVDGSGASCTMNAPAFSFVKL